jgi:hypothetical protein
MAHWSSTEFHHYAAEDDLRNVKPRWQFTHPLLLPSLQQQHLDQTETLGKWIATLLKITMATTDSGEDVSVPMMTMSRH